MSSQNEENHDKKSSFIWPGLIVLLILLLLLGFRPKKMLGPGNVGSDNLPVDSVVLPHKIL
jgi:hypothetical protein